MQKITLQEYKAACKKHASALTEADKLKAEKADRLKEVEQEFTKSLEKQGKIYEDTYGVIAAYCEQNREELFPTAKSIDTGYGITVGFRTSPKKLLYADGTDAEALLATLKRKGLDTYITVKESVNAQAIIKADEDKKLNGALQNAAVTVAQEESFFTKIS